MKVQQKTLISNKKEIPYTHIENGNEIVCFMFSGISYTYDQPLLYYSTMTMLQNEYDVVHVHYSYGQDIFKLPLAEITNMICHDVKPIIDDVLKSNQYQETVFLGKSLGTIPIINDLIKNNMYVHSKMVLLTPLLRFDSLFETLLMCNHSTLIVIGEKDAHYIPSKIESIQHQTNIEMKIIPNANHSLEMEPFHTAMSISALDQVMKSVDDFIGL